MSTSAAPKPTSRLQAAAYELQAIAAEDILQHRKLLPDIFLAVGPNLINEKWNGKTILEYIQQTDVHMSNKVTFERAIDEAHRVSEKQWRIQANRPPQDRLDDFCREEYAPERMTGGVSKWGPKLKKDIYGCIDEGATLEERHIDPAFGGTKPMRTVIKEVMAELKEKARQQQQQRQQQLYQKKMQQITSQQSGKKRPIGSASVSGSQQAGSSQQGPMSQRGGSSQQGPRNLPASQGTSQQQPTSRASITSRTPPSSLSPSELIMQEITCVDAAVAAFLQLGMPCEAGLRLDRLKQDLQLMLANVTQELTSDQKQELHSCTSVGELLDKVTELRCVAVLANSHDPKGQAKYWLERAKGEVSKEGPRAFSRMWNQLVAVFSPTLEYENMPEKRKKKTLLVIGPGFGFVKNPRQIDTIRASGYLYENVFPEAVPKTEAEANAGFEVVKSKIAEMKTAGRAPAAVLCASKGGLYMAKLWRAGYKIPSLMINRHPHATTLPKDVPIVIAHGEDDDVWKVDRGFVAGNHKPKAESLEHTITTGSPGKCYLYYTRNQGGVKYRVADGHDMSSLLENDCLPRLIDSIVFPSQDLFANKKDGPSGVDKGPMPALTFPLSSIHFLHPARREAEHRLSYDPVVWFNTYVKPTGRDGKGDVKRFTVDSASQEFKDVCTIFLSEPQGTERFYVPDKALQKLTLDQLHVERVENDGQEGQFMAMRGDTNASFAEYGVNVVGGATTRWLFHGTGFDGTEAILDKIVKGDKVGYDVAYADKALWGKGSYFARDAHYSIFSGFGRKCKAEKNGTLYKLILLNLVQVGVPTLGEEHLSEDDMPYIKEAATIKNLRYTSTTDCVANPELFCLPQNFYAYPAYVIWFPANIGPS